MPSDRSGEDVQPFRVAFVPGVTPDKWARAWQERMPKARLELVPVEEDRQTAMLHERAAEMCFVRLPVHDPDLHIIPLYHEVTVVVVAKEHFVAAADEVTVADLVDEHLLQDPDTVPEWRDIATEVRDGTRPPLPPITMKQAIETVAAGVGIVVVPMSVARLHHRKDVLYRPVVDLPQSRIGLAWRRDLDDERTETFIGIVRGRTAGSSRGPRPESSAKHAQPTKRARTSGRRGGGRSRRGQ